ncbi:T9SS type A sorting domain-containing protein [uncultured Draconibacterium sp.]|uniref:T9SS type A sorting domain-containing protein n=1 Tax=uncultured Draconibacterium sp. TaxID=1573823 RepID=UPI0029C7215F|nr:T9SS type A sorting domain-containing protein [uncultured Draconibacterium sp.]
MKKILLVVVFGIAMFQLIYAQSVEVIGVGVLNDDTPSLTIPNPGTVDHVVVEATAIYDNVTPGMVTFYDADDTYADVPFNYTEQNLSPEVNGAQYHFGYFTATFNDVDATITLDKTSEGISVKSFVAYIYRTGSGPELWSSIMYDHAFVYHNGSDNPLIYNFSVPATVGNRDIEVVIPFTDLESGTPRYANVTVTAGGVVVNSEFMTNNEGALLRLERIILSAVPGDVTDVHVEIYSPKNSLDGKVGDSFITGSVSLMSEELDPGCTLTQGYWKTHSVYGPASKADPTWLLLANGPDTEFYLSGQTWLKVFNTSAKGNAYYILAHQYMAAYLNMLKETLVPTIVADALSDAESIFKNKGPAYYQKEKGESEASKAEIQELTDLASTLADYNEGRIGPGHCGEETYDMEKSAIIDNQEEMGISELRVFPNPIKNLATISFTPKFTAKATIDIYNSVGQKVKRIYDKNVVENIPVTVNLKSAGFNEGLYLLVIQNGSNRQTSKIIIDK